ncbi:MAG: YraN family protein [Flavobacteriaceae bacterium]|jgi:putative endonuclease|nr:YraN family protein [Flavobacteriaceae bacterium]
MAKNHDLGKEGELAAAKFLEETGYTILEMNWRYKKAEADIIAMKDDILVIAEVKTRSSLYFGLPQDFVTQKKINLLIGLANAYVEEQALSNEIRFDILSLYKNRGTIEIEHIPNAFYHF